MMLVGATNVIASRPPERRRTGTPTARAKIMTERVASNIVSRQPPEKQPTATQTTRANLQYGGSLRNIIDIRENWKIHNIRHYQIILDNSGQY